MARYRRSALAVLGLVALALFASACAKPASQTTPPAVTTAPSTQAGSSTTSAATTQPAVASNEITTPPTGSAERKALLDAARKHFSTSSEFYVHQLYVQNGNAIGEIARVSGDAQRQYVAWAGSPQWTVVWTEPSGSSKASAAVAESALPSFSDTLVDKISWAPVGPSSAQIAAKKTSLASAAKKWSKSTMNGEGQPYKVTLNKVARDSHGVWWGHIVTQPSSDANSSYEPINFWAKYSGGAWKGSVQDPEPPPANSYFPASVIPKLGL